jgi:citrate lyase beta subunit
MNALLHHLGATLYVPGTHPDLLAIANGHKLSHVRSFIFCTEDAIAEQELELALHKLAHALQHMPAQSRSLRFVRVRNTAIMARILAMPGVEKLSGFVLPKATRHNFAAYFALIQATNFMLMPTLETAEVFDDDEMKQFRRLLEAPEVRQHILALRIGGNDLLALLGMRRPRNLTLYRTPLGPLIGRLVTTFRPWGFGLTAPVFEQLNNPALLDQEVQEDLAHGMVGKTAIHPDQVSLIERHYQVGQHDVEMAQQIVYQNNPAVFQMQGTMCEVATHSDWARTVLSQAQIFGTKTADLGNMTHN